MTFQTSFNKVRNQLSIWQNKPVNQNLKHLDPILEEINKREPQMLLLSDGALKSQFRSIRESNSSIWQSEENLIEVYALIREACRRTLGMRPYDVQILTALALDKGELAEMKTGEGKTLAAVFPAIYNSLSGKGVHILTFNDYLARRDALWMSQLYDFFSISVGYIQESMNASERKDNYACDVMYATAKEAGFDFLRSFLAYDTDEIVSRGYHYAIVDEADAILIDEARNPLVMAGDILKSDIDLSQVAQFAARLDPETDVKTDEYARNVFLTDSGIQKAEIAWDIPNLFEEKYHLQLAAINLSLHARFLLTREIDYIIKNEKIILIDEFTGRTVKDRKWQHGLQMAVEAKEGVPIQAEGGIMGSTSFPIFMKQYEKIAAMTATAIEAADEFAKVYGMQTVPIPPNVPCKRIDLPDLIFTNSASKQNALISHILEIHQTGQPILVGTHSVKESADLAKTLRKKGLKIELLNANNDELEAEIIADAGAFGALTISTNMAGRGTDIKLGGKSGKSSERVRQLGGLHVIGTNRHESLRIDNQLKGRAGRQGDPGSSQFIVSFEDELMVKYKLKTLLPAKLSNLEQSEPLQIPVIPKRVMQSQRIIEGQMQDARKNLADYSAVLENQRVIFQQERQDYLLKLEDEISEEGRIKIQFIINQYDQYWARHLDFASNLKEGIYLLRLGGENPLRQYNKKLNTAFEDLIMEFDQVLLDKLKNSSLEELAKEIEKPSSTWNYVVNDSPFENQLLINVLAASLLGSART